MDSLAKIIFDEFITEQKNRNNSPRTIAYYIEVVGYFFRIIHIPFEQIQICHIWQFLEYLRSRGCASSTITNRFRGLKAYYRWCSQKGYKNNIFKDVKMPKSTKRIINILTQGEIKILLKSLENRNKIIILMMLECGLRHSEVCNIKKSDYYEKYLKVKGKGDKERIVPVSEYARPYFNNWFETHQDLNVTYNSIKMLFQKLKVKTGIKRIYPHLLRHTFATYYILHGGSEISLMLILGHTNLEMVKVYVHLAEISRIIQMPSYSPLSTTKRA